MSDETCCWCSHPRGGHGEPEIYKTFIACQECPGGRCRGSVGTTLGEIRTAAVEAGQEVMASEGSYADAIRVYDRIMEDLPRRQRDAEWKSITPDPGDVDNRVAELSGAIRGGVWPGFLALRVMDDAWRCDGPLSSGFRRQIRREMLALQRIAEEIVRADGSGVRAPNEAEVNEALEHLRAARSGRRADDHITTGDLLGTILLDISRAVGTTVTPLPAWLARKLAALAIAHSQLVALESSRGDGVR